MCSAIGAIVSVAGSILQGISANNAAKAQANIARQQAEYQAQVLEQNAAQARNDSESVARQGRVEEGKLRDKHRQIQGSQSAAYGASGLSLASGTPTDVSVSTAAAAEQDIDLLRQNYQQQKFRYINEAVSLQNQANMSRTAGENTASALRSQGKAALVGSLLTSAGTVASKWDTIFGSSAGTRASAATSNFGIPVRSNASLPSGWGWTRKSITDNFGRGW